MKWGSIIATGAQPIAWGVDHLFGTNLRNCPNCHQMEQDFNNAEQYSDYAKAVVDRLYKRGNYKPKT